MDPSLSRRTFDAFAWRMVTEWSRLGLQAAVQLVLAWLLPIEAFGLLAVAALVVNLGSRVSEIGTGPAVIQRAELTSEHVRVAFSLSMLCGALVSAAVWISAPAAAAVFETDAVTPVLRLLAAIFVVSSAGSTAEALMVRALDYRRLLRVELVSYALGYALVGITLALLHYGVWALAWAAVAQAGLKTAMLLAMTHHPVVPCFSPAPVRAMLNFGLGTTIGRLASFAAHSADSFVVARWLGTAALGLYSRAYQLMFLPLYLVSSALNAVLFPAYSSVQTERERLKRGYLTSLSFSSLAIFPALTCLAIVAPEFILGIFGAKWTGAVVPLQILCAAGCAYSVSAVADSLARAKGAVYEKALYQGFYGACVLGGTIAGSRWGLAGVAVGVAAATAIVSLLMAHLSLRLIRASWTEFLAAQFPGAVMSGAVVAAGLPVAVLLRAAALHPLLIVAGTGLVCAGVAGVLVRSAPRHWLSADAREMIHVAGDYCRDLVTVFHRHTQPTAVQ